MAVTGAIFNSLSFGGVNSADYGIYITGEAVFNAPKRAVEMVTVPGRNGDVAIDQGRWENIEVTYPAGTFGLDKSEFATAISNFRNAIVSQIGYQRLTDTYHPEEYRMAIYIAGLEVEAVANTTAGEFELKFQCKPQRWLVNGATAITVSDGQTLNNPTQYNAEPLLAVEGHGTISFNGYEINLTDPYRGEVVLYQPHSISTEGVNYPTVSTTLISFYANANDVITIKPITVMYELYVWQSSYDDEEYTSVTVADSGDLGGTSKVLAINKKSARLSATLDAITLPFESTSSTSITHTMTVTLKMRYNGSIITRTYQSIISVTYYITGDNKLRVRVLPRVAGSVMEDEINSLLDTTVMYEGITVDSTQWILGTPTYIDCELGDAYKLRGNSYVSLNDHIDLGSDLPKLAPGNNTFWLGENITGLTVTPRWWKL